MIDDNDDLTVAQASKLADDLGIPFARAKALGFPDHKMSAGVASWSAGEVRKWVTAFLIERQFLMRHTLQERSALSYLDPAFPLPDDTPEDLERSALTFVRCARLQ